MKLFDYPLFKITIGFIIGIVIGFKIEASIKLCGYLIFTLLIILYFFNYKNFSKRIKGKIFGFLALILSVLIGIQSKNIHQNHKTENHFSNYILKDSPTINQIKITEKLKPNKNCYRYVAKVEYLDNNNTSGKIILNIDKKLITTELLPGQRCLILSKIYLNQKSKNPSNFDYAKYLERQGIYGQTYASEAPLKIIETQKDIWYYTGLFRNRIITNLRESKFPEKELQVLHALILGQQQDIDPEVMDSYRLAGAVHILSVSGLHVGIVYIFLTYILRPIPNSNSGRFLKLVILLFSLWVFALIAGLAPAIVRAVTMFSFISIGRYFKRKTNIYYTLIVSMLIILLFEPKFITDVGFQLSYLALFFIVWMQPILAQFWNPKYKIVRYLWDIITVSFAAQIGTLPLSLYYFNQFPGLFFITNLMVLPLLSIIMILGVLVCLWASITTVNQIMVLPLQYGIKLINYLIHKVASLEQFVLKDISYSVNLVITTYLFIIFTTLFLKKRNYHYLRKSLLTLILIQLVLIYQKHQLSTYETFSVLNQTKKTHILHQSGSHLKVYTNDSLALSNYNLKNFRIKNNIKTTEIKPINNVIIYKDITTLIIDEYGITPDNFDPKIIILRNSPKINLDRVLLKYSPEYIIADASNYKSYVNLWEQSLHNKDIEFHSTYSKGYFQINLSRNSLH